MLSANADVAMVTSDQRPAFQMLGDFHKQDDEVKTGTAFAISNLFCYQINLRPASCLFWQAMPTIQDTASIAGLMSCVLTDLA